MEIVCLVDGRLETYTDIGQVPATIDNLIKFVPDYIEPPHSEDEHELLHSQVEIFKQLMEKPNERVTELDGSGIPEEWEDIDPD
jgi:hypothetical protein